MNNKFWIIVKEAYRKNVKSWSFIVALLAPLLMVGIVFLVGYFSAKSSGDLERKEIAIVTTNNSVNQVFEKANKNDKRAENVYIAAQTSNKDVYYRFIKNESKAKTQLKNEKIDAYIVVNEVDNVLSANIYSSKSFSQELLMSITQMINSVQTENNLQKTQISSEDLQALAQQAKIETKVISFKDGKTVEGKDYSSIRRLISTLLVVFIFMFIMFFSTSITQEIASEKGTRIMEILLSSVPATTHFYGKIVGVILVVLTQLLSYVLIFGISYKQMQSHFSGAIGGFINDIEFDKLLGDGFYMCIPIIIVSFGLYTVVSALCGSLVSKMEDVPKATQPIIYIAMIGYFSTLMFAGNENSIFIKVFSYVPFTSTFAMPSRLAVGTATVLEAWISVGILLVTTVLLLQLSAKMYQTNVLIYNSSGLFTTFKQGIETMKHNKK